MPQTQDTDRVVSDLLKTLEQVRSSFGAFGKSLHFAGLWKQASGCASEI